MAEELFPNLFRKAIPLPHSPLKAINSYVIRGDGRFLMIDTGMNRPECLEAMEAYIDELDIDLARTDFFITHLHADHLGLVSELVRDPAKTYLHRLDAEVIRDAGHWERMAEAARLNGFPESNIAATIESHPGRLYHVRRPLVLTNPGEGDRIEIGGYSFVCIETPGHSPGHLCLYEPARKILFSGDHVLESITPNISLWSERAYDPLKLYLQSLDKIGRYDVAQVLPGHREPFTNLRRRIDELKEHHETRNEEILALLKGEKLTAYETAARMSWDNRCESWEAFPLPQQWFASGEALAHLRYLQGLGRVQREMIDGKFRFTRRAS